MSGVYTYIYASDANKESWIQKFMIIFVRFLRSYFQRSNIVLDLSSYLSASLQSFIYVTIYRVAWDNKILLVTQPMEFKSWIVLREGERDWAWEKENSSKILLWFWQSTNEKKDVYTFFTSVAVPDSLLFFSYAYTFSYCHTTYSMWMFGLFKVPATF